MPSPSPSERAASGKEGAEHAASALPRPDATAAVLTQLADRIGPGIGDLSFRVRFANGDSIGLARSRVNAIEERDGGVTVLGCAGNQAFRWAFTPWHGGFWVTLDLVGQRGLGRTKIDSLCLTYAPGPDIRDWLIPTIGRHVEDAGLIRVSDLTERAREGTLLRGAFSAHDAPGLFVGTRIPQRCVQIHRIEQVAVTRLALTCSTELTVGLGEEAEVRAEAVWIDARRPLADAIAVYADHLPLQAAPQEPPVGWNSWDFYYSSVSAADIAENVAEIERDPVMASKIRYVVVDMGWNHDWGEWFPNHRFPEGMESLARAIADRGYEPGIWTAPLLVDPLSAPGLRQTDLFVRNEHGDPLRTSGGLYVVDPTHPSAKAFLGDLYRRLRQFGYTFFKVDFVDCLLEATRFHDPTKGHYDALRDLFALIRECAGDESHILGCSLPPGCGPGVVDSGRTGVDIHNQWSHVEWAFDYLQLTYWMHRRIWINDADFLVVRGQETSREAETTVLNPEAKNPRPPKWRRGPVFANAAEARTWANIVALSGGSVFLSDRLSMLNEIGLEIVRPLLEPTGVAATPLDLGDGPRASLWLQEGDDVNRLTVVNWTDSPVVRTVPAGEQGAARVAPVQSFWTGGEIPVVDGCCQIELAPHASEVLVWPKLAPRRGDGTGWNA